MTDTSLYIYICVKHFGMANIKLSSTAKLSNHFINSGVNFVYFLRYQVCGRKQENKGYVFFSLHCPNIPDVTSSKNWSKDMNIFTGTKSETE